MKHFLSSGLFIWAGLLLGVSFVATPAKFLAPNLPLTQALDVGRWTFHVLAIIEWALLLLFVVTLIAGRMRPAAIWRTVPFCLAGVAVALAAETFWLRPILDARVQAIIDGGTVAHSNLHDVYIGLEVLKLVLLLVAGSIAGWASAKEPV